MSTIRPAWTASIREEVVIHTTAQHVSAVTRKGILDPDNYMRYIFTLLSFVLYALNLAGQGTTENLTGKISFISSQNVYVKFKSTAGISAGDTLYILNDNVLLPVLKVNSLSSTSCVGLAISDASLPVDHLVIAKVKKNIPKQPEPVVDTAKNNITVVKTTAPEVPETEKVTKKESLQKIKGSVSAYSYSDFSNSGSNSQRFRYTLSLDAGHIANSKFSVETYISFKHKAGDWAEVKSDLFNALKIYSLSGRYDINKTTQISLGRRINPRISNIGAMDGLQVEKTLNKFVIGALAGARPDYATYGFNPKLLQFGAYAAYSTGKAGTFNETSLAFMQQMNNSNVDRRFLYFQHSSSLFKNVYLFSTFEVDLYRLLSDTVNNTYTPQNTLNLTGLYFSLRYKVTKNLSFTGSYDARKNVMYYETYKTYIDRVLEEEMRQSLRLQADYRITNSMTFGLQGGYRYLKSDPHPSRNLYSYFTYSQIPGVKISLTVNATYLETNYMNGKIAGANLSRDFFNGQLQTTAGYRYVNYSLPESIVSIVQNIGEAGISWQSSKKISLALNYEGAFGKTDKYNRVYFQFRKRF
jgi:hypothetical protein